MLRTTPWMLRTGRPFSRLIAEFVQAGEARDCEGVEMTKDTTTHEFAILFRPTRAVSPEELPKRNAAAREWALGLRADGSLRNAAPLEDDGVVVTRDGVAPSPHDGAVGAVLVVRAKDLESVVALVKGHPGLAYGTAIEVRPVKATPPGR